MMARWRHSRLTYCTSATSISSVHFLEALCACRTSMQAHLGRARRARWAGGRVPAPGGSGTAPGLAAGILVQGEPPPRPAQEERAHRRDGGSGATVQSPAACTHRASLLRVGRGRRAKHRGSGVLGPKSRPPVTWASRTAAFRGLVSLSMKCSWRRHSRAVPRAGRGRLGGTRPRARAEGSGSASLQLTGHRTPPQRRAPSDAETRNKQTSCVTPPSKY